MDILIILNFHYYGIFYCKRWASLLDQLIKKLPAMQETQVWFMG